MSQTDYVPPFSAPKFTGDPLRRDWNDFQHLATQGRYLKPKVLPGFDSPRVKLASVKKQLYNPILPTIRHMERDEVLCRLPDEHSRHTTSLTEEQFQKMDLARSTSYVDLTGLNWHDTGKALMASNDSLDIQNESMTTFGTRLRPDKSQVDRIPGENQLYRSPSLSVLSPSASITKPIRYSYRNYGSGTFDQSTKHTMWPRFHMNTKNSFDSINRMPLPAAMQGIFRSNTMHGSVSTAPWKPSGPVTEKVLTTKNPK